ncbi:hypothetical protein ACHAWO_003866 [Cyclotella atomus]|uniref:Uncharacterized protein n=1 Tax=Cyclotella atomus TaxID=382360 RepID=A0ABD3QNR7_9STRA
MKVLPSLITLTSLTRPDVTSAFNNPCSTRVLTTCSATANRRDFISTAIATSVAVGGSSFFPAVSLADVSDGNSLPQGAAQFSRVIKVRAQLKSVAKRVTEQSSEIDKKEWDKIDDFLRTVYSAGEDMKVITKTMDQSKQAKAEEVIKLLQKLAQAAQGPVSKQDAQGFGTIAAKADGLFEDFLDLLRDVPDEL